MRSTILLSLGISIFYQWTAFASHFSFFPLSASSEFTFQSWASWNLCWHYCSVCRTAHLTGEARTWIWPARKMISLQLNTSAPPINIMVRTENSAWSHLGTYQKKKKLPSNLIPITDEAIWKFATLSRNIVCITEEQKTSWNSTRLAVIPKLVFLETKGTHGAKCGYC